MDYITSQGTKKCGVIPIEAIEYVKDNVCGKSQKRNRAIFISPTLPQTGTPIHSTHQPVDVHSRVSQVHFLDMLGMGKLLGSLYIVGLKGVSTDIAV